MNTLRITLALLVLSAAAFARTEIDRDVVYGKGYVAESVGETPHLRDLVMDVYHAAAKFEGPRPAAVLIHGGSFRTGDKSHDDLSGLARHLAQRGYMCFSINYRLIGDNPPADGHWQFTLAQAAIHAAFVDAKTAIRHVRANAAAYHVDPARIAVIGDSAGAFAALAAGITDPEDFARDNAELPVPPENNPGVDPKPQAVVDLWGSAELIRDKFDADDPPMCIIHGTKDDHIGVTFHVAKNIVAECEAHGIPYVFYPIEGKKHGAWDGKYEGKTINELVTDFLSAHMP
jgi:dipeptidyl aminopeptidase/acylaminoacyl peptidase